VRFRVGFDVLRNHGVHHDTSSLLQTIPSILMPLAPRHLVDL